MKNSVSGVVKFVSEFPFTTGEETGEQEVADEHWYIVGRGESEGRKTLIVEIVVAAPELWRMR
jgi:hypothetical protein